MDLKSSERALKAKKKTPLHKTESRKSNRRSYDIKPRAGIQEHVSAVFKRARTFASATFNDGYDRRATGDCNEKKGILKILNRNHSFEEIRMNSLRWKVLKEISCIVDKWVQERTDEKFKSSPDAANFGGFVVPFGSFALGVHNPGSDIDTLIVAPRHVTREDFFTNFVKLLQNHQKVTNLHTVEDAFVPIVKLTYRGIELDLLFVQSALPVIPSLFSLEQDWILKNVDHKSVRSMHGIRVTEDMLNLVPDKTEFIFTLKAIKFWAKRRGIYGNTYGFPGGVSWALMVAKVCQLCSHQEIPRIKMFFLIFFFWSWPTPVTLRPLYEEHPYLTLPSWNPAVNPRERSHIMPVITPSYPQINSTFNVNSTTLSIIKYELLRGLLLTHCGNSEKSLETLLAPSDFFHRYRFYLILTVKTESSDDLCEWVGVISSKMRHLLLSFQDNPQVALAHILPSTQSTLIKPAKLMHETKWIVGLHFVGSAQEATASLRNDIHNFIFMVNRQVTSGDMYRAEKQISFHIVHKENLKEHISAKELNKCDSNALRDEPEVRQCFDQLCSPDGVLTRPLTKMASRVLDLKPAFDDFEKEVIEELIYRKTFNIPHTGPPIGAKTCVW